MRADQPRTAATTTATTPPANRRRFLQRSTQAMAAGTLLQGAMRRVHAHADETIQLAIVGCGGRGTGAVRNALSVPDARLKLVAMADVFESRLRSSYSALARRYADTVDVPEDRRFLGFDAYKQAMDCLAPGDIVILATPPAFRWVHYAYAIERGLHVFMEKPVTVDAPTCHRMLALNKAAEAKNLKVAVGLMCRHCEARGELYKRIRDGQIGDLITLRAYRMAGPTASAHVGPKPENMSELMYQIKNFHAFLWLSGGAVSDFLIHNIDECCWMKDAWPIEAKGAGGRHYRGNDVDQNFDVYDIEYTFEDGSKLFVNGRTQPGCFQEFASYAHGSKGAATISAQAHTPARCKIYKGQRFTKEDVTWEYGPDEGDPYQLEWNDLVAAIREDRPYNEVERGVMASAVTSMGRMAAHTGQRLTLEEFLQHDHEFAPNVDRLTLDGPSPLQAGPDGTYPVPMPGLLKDREYM